MTPILRKFALTEPASTPRWVRVFWIIVIVLLLHFVILHLAGGGFRGHISR